MAAKPKQEYFDTGLRVSRDDIAALGFKNASRLSDQTMEQLADAISDSPVVIDGWRLALEYACEQAGLQKRKETA